MISRFYYSKMIARLSYVVIESRFDIERGELFSDEFANALQFVSI